MKYVNFGKTNEQVSELCLGTMMFGDRCDEAESDRIVGKALDVGVNFIDTAAMYCDGRTEEILGRILKEKRDKFFLATKVHEGTDEESIVGSIEKSLQRLKTDHVDLYLIHWPRKGMDPQEIMQALHRVVAAGKTRFVGCSNYPAWLFACSNAVAERNGWRPFICNQVPYNLIERGVEVEVLPQAQAENVAITTYRTLVMGLLAGKYLPEQPFPTDSRGQTDTRIVSWLKRYGEGISNFLKFAQELHVPPPSLAVSWVRHSPAVTCPLLGVSSFEQLESSIEAFAFDLTEDQYEKLSKMFDTEVKEESGGAYKNLRRTLGLLRI